MKHLTHRIFLILVTLVLFQADICAAQNLPEIIPHRGGRAERPENTIESFEACIALGVQTLELDVQVTKDGQAVVYHPGDLSVNTDGKGKVSDFTYEDLQKFDAAYKFEKEGNFPYRGEGYKIPLFKDVLVKFSNIRFVIDLKSLPAVPLVDAVGKDVEEQNAWDRVIFYSTDEGHLDYLKTAYLQATAFESRKNTVEELLNATGSPNLLGTEKPIWLGFELVRQFKVTEKLALGDAEYPVNLVVWTEPGIRRIRAKLPGASFVMFGINTVEDYQKATDLEASAVYTDNPSALFEDSLPASHSI
jgi:glycerophosphoryl diester phosphodiesterase